jgi:taurine dioxygenase
MNVAAHNAAEAAGLTVTPMARTIGAEIGGVDLRQPLTHTVKEGIYQALMDWKVVFFRDQELTEEQHLLFARNFGDLEIHPFAPKHPDYPEVLPIRHWREGPGSENIWHSDVTWRLEPSLGSVLRCVKGPPTGGDTLFADMYAAYEGLSDEVKELIEGKMARHDFPGFRYRMRQRGASEEEIAEFLIQYPNPEHPVVRTHPDTGRRALYVNAAFTKEIIGMDKVESDRLLSYLYAQAATPEYQCRFKWQDNSIAFWDNRACQHYAVSDYWPEERHMQRVTIIGDKPSYRDDSAVPEPWEFKGLIERRRNNEFQKF